MSNVFVRTKMREDGFYRRIMPPLAIANIDLDLQVPTDRPIKIIDDIEIETLRVLARLGEPRNKPAPF